MNFFSLIIDFITFWDIKLLGFIFKRFYEVNEYFKRLE